MPRTICMILALAWATLNGGCTSNRLLKAQASYRRGDLAQATSEIRSYVKKHGDGNDRVLAYLELGSVLRAAGAYEMSNDAFRVAEQAIDAADQKADVALSKEATSLLTNLNAMPYRGYNYDRIMLSTYRALNCLELDDLDGARVALRRVYQRQVEAAQVNAHRIEAAQEAARQSLQANASSNRPTVNVARTQGSERLQATLQQRYSSLDAYARYDAYSDYVNPFSEFLQGLYFTTASADGGDLERGRVALRRATSMVPANTYLQADLAMAEQLAVGASPEPVTYVIFETGTAPSRDELRIDLPLFLVNDEVTYIGANFPMLHMHHQYAPTLLAQAANLSYPAALLADMDGIIAREFKNDLPAVVARTLIAAGAKAAVAYGLKEATKHEDPWISLGTQVAAAIYMIAVNQADLRTWATLPKQIQYARFPTPTDGRVHISIADQSPLEVLVKSGQTNVIMIRSITPAAPPGVATFDFKR